MVLGSPALALATFVVGTFELHHPNVNRRICYLGLGISAISMGVSLLAIVSLLTAQS